MNYYHRRIAEKKLTKIYRQNDHDILISKSTDSKIFIGNHWKSWKSNWKSMPKMICLYQTRPDKQKSKLLLRPQTLVVSAPRSSGEYLDFGDFKILSSMDPWIKIIMIKIMEYLKIRYPKSQIQKSFWCRF